ncbi:oxidoreductase [Candidatus Bipolaricaulota bacterium]|nr:oxidoreductase [Candidatus Bipolaricaulota bacterium]
MAKAKIGIYWAAACGGCDCALLEVNEQILDVVAAADILLWPCAADPKYSDLRDYKNGEIDIVLFNGAIRTQENVELAQLIRTKTKYLVAFGSCAQSGGVIGLANQSSRNEIFSTVFGDQANWPQLDTNKNGHDLHLPEFLPRLTHLADVVEVDYVVPGCPPPKQVVSALFSALVAGELPATGTVFASSKNLCEECSREREQLKITQILRPHENDPDTEKCLLDQGFMCMGPATRGGCLAVCPAANMPCTGCAGPTAAIRDQGAAMLNTVASLIGTGEEGEDQLAAEDAILAQFDDIVGTFYRFGAATSIFKERYHERNATAR